MQTGEYGCNISPPSDYYSQLHISREVYTMKLDGYDESRRFMYQHDLKIIGVSGLIA
jgi:hypothetical protein